MGVPRASIIVRSFNEAKHIGKLLHGVAAQQYDNLEMIVVDSGSTDGTVEIAQKFDVKLVQIRPEDFSFGRALNLGCSAATGEFLVMVSAHVYPTYQDWLPKLLKPFADPRVAAVYGKQRGAKETKFSEHQIFRQWFPDTSVPLQNTPFCNNANCAVRRELWEQLHYDEELTGLEDLAWAKQALERGHLLSYAADAEIIHVHEETPARVMNRYMREAIALKRIYPEQGMSLGNFVSLFVGNTLADFFHAAVERRFWRNAFEIPVFRFMQFYGAYRGFKQQGPITRHLRRTFYYPRSLRRELVPGQEDPRLRINYDAALREVADVD